jgi:hypothetical protein
MLHCRRADVDSGVLSMTAVSTLDITDLTAPEYRAVMDELGVEQRPEGGIYLHLTTATDAGFRVVEIWDQKENFDRFVERRSFRRTRPVASTARPRSR